MPKKKQQRNVTGAAIQRLRVAALPKISQNDMAGRLARFGVDLNQSQIAKIESGERIVADYEVVAFAKALKVQVHDLFS